MQFSSYWVSLNGTSVTIDQEIFNETELTPESNWKEAWQNIDLDAGTCRFVTPRFIK